MVFERCEDITDCNIYIKRMKLEQVMKFVYLGTMLVKKIWTSGN